MVSLYTSQVPESGNNAEPGGITTATAFTVSAPGTVSAIRFFSTTTVGGTYTAQLWEATAADNPPPGAGTLLASKAVVGTPAAGQWVTVALDAPVAVVPGQLYKAALYSSEGRYVSTANLFLTGGGGIVNGPLTGPEDGSNPTGLGTLAQGSFTTGGPAAYPDTSFNDAGYFVDVVFELATAQGVAAFGVGLTVAGVGDAPGVAAAQGAADYPLALVLAAEGEPVVPAQGVVAFGVGLGVAVTGSAPAGPNDTGVCGWTIDPAALGVCDDWAERPAGVRAAALRIASLYMWGATGRQFGICPTTVRPQQGRDCGPLDGYRDYVALPGQDATGGGPYLFGGRWYNAGCGTGCCSDGCAVVLRGPVASVISVVVADEVLEESAYRVDVQGGQYLLMRTGGSCWPTCAREPGSFEVTYGLGKALPIALAVATAQLACEYAKSFAGGACALPARMTRLSRQGVEVQIEPPSPEAGLTGMREVDAVITALNPSRRQDRPVLLSPDLAGRRDRMTIWGG